MQIRQLLQQATKYLEDNHIETAKTDAEVLLCNLIGTNRIELYLNDKIPLNKNKLEQYWKLLDRRASHEPVAYISGKKEFMDWEFIVNPDVLIPRAETEILVEEIINIGGKMFSLIIVDIGTGSGAIAISLALTLKAKVYAIDISTSALEVAKRNATKLGVEDRITFLKGDLFSPLKDINNEFDFIVSNPPYISTSQFQYLPLDIRFEPRIALDGGEEGLNFYDKIINGSLDYLKEGGYLALEVGGETQSKIINDKILQTKRFDEIKIIKDYAGINRIIIASKRSSRRR